MSLLAACDNRSAFPSAASPNGRLGTVIGGGRARTADGERFFVGMVDLDSNDDGNRVRVIQDIDFFGHGICPNPVKPDTAIVCEKHGPGCCEIDMRQGRVLRRIPTLPGREFYGHSAFSPDGKFLYTTEAIVGDGSKTGVLAIRDGESFELLGSEFPTHGVAPHDCLLVDNGDTLIVTNGGGAYGDATRRPSVAYVDVRTGKLRRLLDFKNDMINAGHLAITSKGELVCISAPRDGIDRDIDGNPNPAWLGAIGFYHPDKNELIAANDPITKKMRGETLSVAIHEPSMIVAATNPDADLVTFWDFRTGRLVHKIEGEFKHPRGISLTLDGTHFALTHDLQTQLVLIDAQTFSPVAASAVQTTYISGSHNIVYAL